ncbi:MAG TPA: DUF378 domain-containing protein [Candidatus Pacearchaeota archaeon]|nr:DUF378 domain-containing protein [Candidatus Pacearchaeota archaeon]
MNPTLKKLFLILIVVGAINWGLTALGFNLVTLIFGSWPMVEKLVYFLVGVAGLWGITLLF